MPHKFLRSAVWLLPCGLALALIAGCQEDQIRSYTVPKDAVSEPPMVRTLAVMVTRGPDNWFFKFTGRKRVVGEHEEAFDAFIRSIRFPAEGEVPITWKVPPGWREQPAAGFRYATLRFGPKEEGVEITVIKLGPQASDLRDNLDRWRGQIGLPKIDDDELRQLKGNIKVDGIEATRVDLVGPGAGAPVGPASRAGPPAGAARLAAPAPQYTRPNGWEVRPADVKKGIRRPLVLRVTDGGKEAEISGVMLPGNGGGLLANVDRWRRQLGLGPAGDADLRRDLRELTVGGVKCPYVDLTGPGAAPQRILGAIVRHDNATWFLTMKGPADLVGKQQPAFEAFVQSIHFGGQGAAHE